MTNEQIIQKVRSLLTETDLKVAEIGFRFVEDTLHGYGGFYDGQEEEIVQAYAWLAQQVAGCEPSPQELVHFPRREYDESTQSFVVTGMTKDKYFRYRPIRAPDGVRHDPTSLVNEYSLEDEDERGKLSYEGLNHDPDCAISELLAGVGSGYQLYAKGYSGGCTPGDMYAKQFEALGLTPEACAKRCEELYNMSHKLMDETGKHDRSETRWC